MFEIKAPFNFVPISDKVFYPDWADCISQDIPFEDSVSGSITLKITAKSPIFVRNGHTKADADDGNSEYKSFSNDNGKFFIPGTSIKGTIRSVFEAMSFGKMKTQETHKYAHREWDENKQGLYDIKKSILKLRCGWLKRLDDDSYCIYDCGRPWRIGFDALDAYLGNPLFENNFSDAKTSNADLNAKQKDAQKTEKYQDDPKSSFYKYRFFDSLGKSYEQLRFSHVKAPTIGKDGKPKDNRRLKVDPNGDIEGTIVITGQPAVTNFNRDKCEKGAGKFYEFVFVDEFKKKYPISEEYYKELAYIYRKNPEWAYHEQKVKTRGIPVFFRVENGELKDFGLAFMYKQPFEKAPSDWIPVSHKEKKHDLAECMFGYISEDGSCHSLRGRVQFGHAFCSKKAGTQEKIGYVLATPHASFYPLYTRNDNYMKKGNWDDAEEISGRKRYILRQSEYGVQESIGTDSMKSSANVLNAGTEFCETIVFHNLKKIELGALLSALTFHGNASCLHSIGQGKPFGWGATLISILEVNVNGQMQEDYLQYMGDFEKVMDSFLESSWIESECMRELIALATPIPVNANEMFSYLKLDNQGVNEFNLVKGMANLDSFTKIVASKNLNNWKPNEPMTIVGMSAEEKEVYRKQMASRIAEMKAKEADAQAQREAIEQEQQAEKAKADAKLVSMDLSFLSTKNSFKEGKAAVETKFKQAGLDKVCVETMDAIPEIAKQQIVYFVKLMFARPDKKWGAKNKDMAKDAAKVEVKTWLGPEFTCPGF